MTDVSGIVLSRKASVVPLHAERVQTGKIKQKIKRNIMTQKRSSDVLLLFMALSSAACSILVLPRSTDRPVPEH